MRTEVVNSIVATSLLGNVHSGQGCGGYVGNSTENYIGLAYHGMLGIISGGKVIMTDEEIQRETRDYNRPRRGGRRVIPLG